MTLHEGRVAAAIEAMEPDSADGDDESITYVLRAEAARVAREASR